MRWDKLSKSNIDIFQGIFIVLIRLCRLFPLLFLFLVPAAFANDAVTKVNEGVIKKAVEQRFPGATVSSVTKTPYFGLYEVFIENDIIYTDEKVNYIIVGKVLDMQSMQDLTQERLRKLTAISFDQLPLDLAIKTVKGSGKRKVAMFSDPDCPFCKRLEREMVNVTDVTIYTFLYPIEALHPGAGTKARAVWCADDRVKAWNDLMLNGNLPRNDGSCDNPVAKINQLGQKSHINATPTLIFPDGQMVPGLIPVSELESHLNAGNK